MKPLLATNCPLYLKRLARELNALEAGFYADHGTLRARFSRSRYSKGKLEAKPLGCARGWIELTDKTESISDAYGRSVYASRATA